MNYKYETFQLKNQKTYLSFLKELLNEFVFEQFIDNEYNYNCELYYKKNNLPTYILYTNSDTFDNNYLELLDGYYLDQKIINTKYKEYKNFFTKPLRNDTYILILIIETNNINDYLKQLIKYGSLLKNSYYNSNHYRVPIVIEKSTNKLFLSDLLPGSTFYFLNEFLVFKEIRNFIVNSLKGKYTEKVSFKATKGNKMVLNSLPQKKVLYKYNVKRPINISEAIILILVSIILFKNIIIVVTVIIFTSAIVYAFYPRNNESIAWEKYKRIKLQKELQMNDIKEILKDKKIEYYEKNDKIEIKTNKGKIIILKGSERNKKGKELVLSLEKDWINIINNNSVLLKIFIKIIYSYM